LSGRELLGMDVDAMREKAARWRERISRIRPKVT